MHQQPNPDLRQSTPKTAFDSNKYEKWRLFVDRCARYAVVLGGLGVIVAIVMIFFYLLYVVLPLFGSASAEAVAEYAMPDAKNGKTLLLETEEQNEVAARYLDNGEIVFFELAGGKILSRETIKIPEGTAISAFGQNSLASHGVVVYGLTDGTALVVRTQFKVTYQNNIRRITAAIEYPMGEQPLAISPGDPIDKIAIRSENGEVTMAATVKGAIRLVSLSREESLFADEAKLNRTEAEITLHVEHVAQLALDKQDWHLFVLDGKGKLYVYDLNDKSKPKLKFQQQVVGIDDKVTAMAMLNGDLSLMIGDSVGRILQWTHVKDAYNHPGLAKIRAFKLSSHPILAIEPEQRRKGFVAVDSEGNVGIFHSTSEREMLTFKMASGATSQGTLSPRANRLLFESVDGKALLWRIDNEHPEVSFNSIWKKVWYESYSKPDYIWQSSSASNDFEPKYSLTPLVFGTLKAAFYAMLFALPLALLGAIYTAYFMSPKMRQIVKPTIELMGALPTVILGFLAGLWLAPFIEKHLAGLFLTLLSLPLAVILFSYCWYLQPSRIRERLAEGWEALILIPVIMGMSWLSFQLAGPLEGLLFDGSLRDWFSTTLGIGYDQRNALVVGIAMGFAVIPSIFSIAEDAIFSVPKHLTIGSLALGATPWQTMTRVVLLTASPGIFSAVMIGLGRAIGETMIVLMATGNTPVMDFSVFQGLRTLAANVAVEMPESEVDSTHYRVLFLAALVLFMATFVFNTLAEIVRQRLREKYSSL